MRVLLDNSSFWLGLVILAIIAMGIWHLLKAGITWVASLFRSEKGSELKPSKNEANGR